MKQPSHTVRKRIIVHEIKMYVANITFGNKSKMLIKVSDDDKVADFTTDRCMESVRLHVFTAQVKVCF